MENGKWKMENGKWKMENDFSVNKQKWSSRRSRPKMQKMRGIGVAVAGRKSISMPKLEWQS